MIYGTYFTILLKTEKNDAIQSTVGSNLLKAAPIRKLWRLGTHRASASMHRALLSFRLRPLKIK
jgi:hypothetical protein